jgi:hypothetical protein
MSLEKLLESAEKTNEVIDRGNILEDRLIDGLEQLRFKNFGEKGEVLDQYVIRVDTQSQEYDNVDTNSESNECNESTGSCDVNGEMTSCRPQKLPTQNDFLVSVTNSES